MTLQRRNNDFSYTKLLNDITVNSQWRNGYDDVKEGNFTSVNGKADLAAMSPMGSLWYLLSAACEDVGNTVYDKVHNFIPNTLDIDTCEYRSLRSIGQTIGMQSIPSFDISLPQDLADMVNVFSLPQSQTLASAFLKEDIKNQIISACSGSVSAVTTTGTFTSVDMDAYWTVATEMISSTINNNIFANTSSYFTELKKDVELYEIDNTYKLIPDSKDVTDVKLSLNVPLSFNANYEMEKLKKGVTILQDYTIPEQRVLEYVLGLDVNKNENTREKFTQDKKNLVREYIGLVENLNTSTGEIDSSMSILSVLGNDYINSADYVSFFSADVATRNQMIIRAAYKLRNFCIDILQFRSNLKTMVQKYELAGTNNLVKVLLIEYIKRKFTDPTTWNYHVFNDLSGHIDTKILNLFNGITVENLIGANVDIVEYYDTTEYFNLSATTDLANAPYSSILNPRYWQDNDTINGVPTNTEHTSGDVLDFYKNLGVFDYLDKTDLWGSLTTWLDNIYSLGARNETNLHNSQNRFSYTDGSLYTKSDLISEQLVSSVPLSGSFGDYGYYEWNGGTNVKLTANVELYNSVDDLSATTYLSTWKTSPFVSAWTDSTIASSWLSSHYNNLWYDNVDVTIGTSSIVPGNYEEFSITVTQPNQYLPFDNLSQVQTWIVDNFSENVSGLLETGNTDIWRQSPLINNWSTAKFKDEWTKSVETYNTPASAITSFWTDVDTLKNNTSGYNWHLLSEVQDYLLINNVALSTLTQEMWTSSYFVRSWTVSPFTEGTLYTNLVYDHDTDWATLDNPFVSAWLDDSSIPYDLTDTIKRRVYKDKTFDNVGQALRYIYTKTKRVYGNLPDGLMNQSTNVTSDYAEDRSTSLTNMNNKFINDRTLNPAFIGNLKNSIHPSMAILPYIWNLIEVGANLYTFKQLYYKTNQSLTELAQKFDSLIDYDGHTINHWKKDAFNYTGYKTSYQDNYKIDVVSYDENPDKAHDGPFNPFTSVFETYLNLPVSGITSDNVAGWYDHIDSALYDLEDQVNNLTIFNTDIVGLSGKFIYQYGVDSYGNSYTLYKNNSGNVAIDIRDYPGEMWIRIKDQPFSFPMYSSENTLLDFSLIGSNDIFNSVYDFGFEYVDGDKLLWVYSTSGVYVVKPALVDQDVTKISMKPLFNDFNRFQDFSANDVFIGVTNRQETELVMVNATINDSDSIDIKFSTYDNTYGVQANAKIVSYDLNYPIHVTETFGVTSSGNFRMTDTDTEINIAFEVDSPNYEDGSFRNSWDKGFYTISGNVSSMLYENGICTLEWNDIGPISDIYQDADQNYYFPYTDVTYVGLVEGTGLSGDVSSVNAQPIYEYHTEEFADKIAKFHALPSPGYKAAAIIDDELLLIANNNYDDNVERIELYNVGTSGSVLINNTVTVQDFLSANPQLLSLSAICVIPGQEHLLDNIYLVARSTEADSWTETFTLRYIRPDEITVDTIGYENADGTIDYPQSENGFGRCKNYNQYGLMVSEDYVWDVDGAHRFSIERTPVDYVTVGAENGYLSSLIVPDTNGYDILNKRVFNYSLTQFAENIGKFQFVAEPGLRTCFVIDRTILIDVHVSNDNFLHMYCYNVVNHQDDIDNLFAGTVSVEDIISTYDYRQYIPLVKFDQVFTLKELYPMAESYKIKYVRYNSYHKITGEALAVTDDSIMEYNRNDEDDDLEVDDWDNPTEFKDHVLVTTDKRATNEVETYHRIEIYKYDTSLGNTFLSAIFDNEPMSACTSTLTYTLSAIRDVAGYPPNIYWRMEPTSESAVIVYEDQDNIVDVNDHVETNVTISTSATTPWLSGHRAYAASLTFPYVEPSPF